MHSFISPLVAQDTMDSSRLLSCSPTREVYAPSSFSSSPSTPSYASFHLCSDHVSNPSPPFQHFLIENSDLLLDYGLQPSMHDGLLEEKSLISCQYSLDNAFLTSPAHQQLCPSSPLFPFLQVTDLDGETRDVIKEDDGCTPFPLIGNSYYYGK